MLPRLAFEAAVHNLTIHNSDSESCYKGTCACEARVRTELSTLLENLGLKPVYPTPHGGTPLHD